VESDPHDLLRNIAHFLDLLGLGAMALDLGAMSVFLYTFTEREKLYNLFELLTGARFTTSYTEWVDKSATFRKALSRNSKNSSTTLIPSLETCEGC